MPEFKILLTHFLLSWNHEFWQCDDPVFGDHSWSRVFSCRHLCWSNYWCCAVEVESCNVVNCKSCQYHVSQCIITLGDKNVIHFSQLTRNRPSRPFSDLGRGGVMMLYLWHWAEAGLVYVQSLTEVQVSLPVTLRRCLLVCLCTLRLAGQLVRPDAFRPGEPGGDFKNPSSVGVGTRTLMLKQASLKYCSIGIFADEGIFSISSCCDLAQVIRAFRPATGLLDILFSSGFVLLIVSGLIPLVVDFGFSWVGW